MSFFVKFLEIAVFVTLVTADILRPVTIRGNDHGTCLSQNERLETLHIIKTMVNISLQSTNLCPV